MPCPLAYPINIQAWRQSISDEGTPHFMWEIAPCQTFAETVREGPLTGLLPGADNVTLALNARLSASSAQIFSHGRIAFSPAFATWISRYFRPFL